MHTSDTESTVSHACVDANRAYVAIDEPAHVLAKPHVPDACPPRTPAHELESLIQPVPIAAVHLALLYLWQIDLLRLHHLSAVASTAGLYVISVDIPAGQLVPQVWIPGLPQRARGIFMITCFGGPQSGKP